MTATVRTEQDHPEGAVGGPEGVDSAAPVCKFDRAGATGLTRWDGDGDPVFTSPRGIPIAPPPTPGEGQPNTRPQAPADAGETRVTSDTGGQKGQKLARFDLIPADALWELAEAYGRGASKYDDDNWRRGYDWSLSFAALMRHAWAFWGGEDIDPETGTKHIVAVAWHAFTLTHYLNNPNLARFDNRPATS